MRTFFFHFPNLQILTLYTISNSPLSSSMSLCSSTSLFFTGRSFTSHRPHQPRLFPGAPDLSTLYLSTNKAVDNDQEHSDTTQQQRREHESMTSNWQWKSKRREVARRNQRSYDD
ncbi:unnamed protein product [Linum trigynum]|uniref:Uncharacterized protein n=1 Tax=Linum trigynum TaxID=586398 RepID=A0AAV2ES31_9ROSI